MRSVSSFDSSNHFRACVSWGSSSAGGGVASSDSLWTFWLCASVSRSGNAAMMRPASELGLHGGEVCLFLLQALVDRLEAHSFG